MSGQFKTSITYFLQEGRDNLRECLQIAFEAALNHHIEKLVIFTAQGAGVKIALEDFLSDSQFKAISLIGVTFPANYPVTDSEGKPKDLEIAPEDRALFRKHRVPIVRAHLPFEPIAGAFEGRGLLGQDLSLVGNALSVFGGSMSLCVQAVLLSCDAGFVGGGEHVIALTSDTAILAQACATREMLTKLAVREILCKPAVYSIGRQEQLTEQGIEKETKKELKSQKELQQPTAEILPPESKS